MNKTVWIRPATGYYGEHGSFPADIPAEITEAALEAIKKEINVKRARLPKELRGEVPIFRYVIIPAPWDAQKDLAQEEIDSLRTRINEVQATITAAAARKNGMLVDLKAAKDDVLQFLKLKQKDLEAPGELRRLYRKACIREESLAIEIEQREADLAEHEKALRSLAKQLSDLLPKEPEPQVEAPETMIETPQDKMLHTGPDDRQKTDPPSQNANAGQSKVPATEERKPEHA
jgi:cysteinyl-tRNA synthetase